MNNIHYLLVLSFLSIGANLFAQKYEYVYRDASDSSRNCYLKVIPEGGIQAVLIRDFSSLPDTSVSSRSQLHILAAQKGIMTVFTVTSKQFPELGVDTTVIDLLDELIGEVVQEHNLNSKMVFIGGVSSSGSRAMLYAEYCAKGRSKFNVGVKGVFAVDSPLDYERLWREAFHAKNRNFERYAVEEGQMLLDHFQNRMGGSPYDDINPYHRYSPYCYSAHQGGNIQYLNDVAVRMYIEPDIQWWIEEKRKDYYDINAIDAAAAINQLKLMGNKRAELIVTQDKGYLKDGSKHPHSWTLVDEPEMVNWMIKLIHE